MARTASWKTISFLALYYCGQSLSRASSAVALIATLPQLKACQTAKTHYGFQEFFFFCGSDNFPWNIINSDKGEGHAIQSSHHC